MFSPAVGFLFGVYVGLAGLMLNRLALGWAFGWLARQGHLRRRVAVLGSAADADTLLESLKSNTDDFQLVGHFGTGSEAGEEDGIAELIKAGQLGGVDEIVVAGDLAQNSSLRTIVERLGVLPVDVWICVNDLQLGLPVREAGTIGDVTRLKVQKRPMNEWVKSSRWWRTTFWAASA